MNDDIDELVEVAVLLVGGYVALMPTINVLEAVSSLTAATASSFLAVSSMVLPLLPVLLVAGIGFAVVHALRNSPRPYDSLAVGERRRVVETEKSVSECVNCELEGVDGVLREARHEFALFGWVGRVYDTTVNEECTVCHEADTVEYGLRAAQADPAPPGGHDEETTDETEAKREGDLTRIMHVGDAVARNLRQHGFETVADVRDADLEELVDVPRIGEQRAEDVQLGATHIGLEFGVDLARRLDREGFETAADIRAASVEELTEVRGVGQVTAKGIKSAVPEVSASEHDVQEITE
ncbi:hypothetical protein Harman_11740 [Haloarcula mannanilytica]|uniref:Helix-hairpin-helix DNA-binding motif class 1 domain-containing protein n=1 Tax=Haloarcula mannanilytica TaxID=2509225 RepID=A0A4C2EM06_9EURY|nr:helix-hairpin-helix domain-containing protein [Haloarcula mannanilytica]GCF13239.1 hypothetical protein Harman_11740 [Haloarcula mannanilytica]